MHPFSAKGRRAILAELPLHRNHDAVLRGPKRVRLFLPDDYTPADLARATTIPSRWYLDPQFLDLERARVFAKTWQPVALAKTVAEPGTFAAVEIAGEPVVVARAKDGVLRAFSNVCRHRASLIADGCGKSATLRCPYHGWTYALDGRLLACPEFEGVLDWETSSVRLPEYRVETWGPYVFVNQDLSAPPLETTFGDIPDQVAKIGCAVDRLEFSERREYLIDCNWKVYIDNYLEGYHLPAAHPSLFRELDYSQYRVDTFRYYSSQYAPIRPPRAGQPDRRYAADGLNALYYWIFPNFMLNVYPDNLSSNIIVPLSPDKTLTIFEWFGYPGSPVRQETIAFSDEIQQEDIKICERVQKGLRSRTYDTGRFSVKRENGVHHFHLLLNEFLS
jgi:choline monooxygenase